MTNCGDPKPLMRKLTVEEANEIRKGIRGRFPELVRVQGEVCVTQADSLVDMMNRQLELQLKLNPDFLSMTNEQIMDYVRNNALALIKELAEMLDETNWKTWSTAEPGIKSRSRYLKEIIDAQHFLFNLALAAGVKPHEYYLAYIAKNETNFKRQDNEYDGNNPRCEYCGNEIETYNNGGLVKREEIYKPSKWWCNDQCYDAQQVAIVEAIERENNG